MQGTFHVYEPTIGTQNRFVLAEPITVMHFKDFPELQTGDDFVLWLDIGIEILCRVGSRLYEGSDEGGNDQWRIYCYPSSYNIGAAERNNDLQIIKDFAAKHRDLSDICLMPKFLKK